jgi:Flp pilus assembly protein TadG
VKMLRDERGQVLIFMALVMGLVMIGFLALGLDVGYMFHAKRMAQSAADAAAVAAAEELSIGGSAEQNAANIAATKNGFDTTLANKPAVVNLTTMTAGNYSNANGATAPSNWVQAVVSQPIHSFFLGAFIPGMKWLTVSASAKAGINVASPTCICLLGTSGDDLDMSNNAKLSASTSCAITADSTSSNAITVVGSASVCANSVGTVSTTWDYSTGLYGNGPNINNGGSICTAATKVTGAAACAAQLVQPALPSGITCYDNPINGWTAANNYTGVYTLPLSGETATNNTFCYNSLNLSNAKSVTFQSGYTYYVKGDFTTGGGAPVSGSNVTFIVTGNVNIANGVTVNLSAPTTNGVYGTLFYVDGTTVHFQGGSGSTLNGTVYAPSATVTLDNGTTTATMDVVAQKLVMAGGAKLTTYANPALGSSSNGTPALSQ